MVTTALRADEIDWDTPTPWTAEDRVFEFFGLVIAHVKARHNKWHRRYGNHLADVDDLAGVALESLVYASRDFEALAAAKGGDAATSRPLFWTICRERIRWDIQKYVERRARVYESVDDFDAETHHEHPVVVRTSLYRFVPPSLMHHTIADAVAQLDERYQILLALRYFEELSVDAIAELAGVTPSNVGKTIAPAVQHVLTACYAEVMDDPPVPVPLPRLRKPIGQGAHRYVLERYDTTVSNYLTYVHRCYRADVSYIVDFIDRAHGGRIKPAAPKVDEPCSYDGCTTHVYTRGICNKHWQRERNARARASWADQT